jgi:hypothetical protein
MKSTISHFSENEYLVNDTHVRVEFGTKEVDDSFDGYEIINGNISSVTVAGSHFELIGFRVVETLDGPELSEREVSELEEFVGEEINS